MNPFGDADKELVEDAMKILQSRREQDQMQQKDNNLEPLMGPMEGTSYQLGPDLLQKAATTCSICNGNMNRLITQNSIEC